VAFKRALPEKRPFVNSLQLFSLTKRALPGKRPFKITEPLFSTTKRALPGKRPFVIAPPLFSSIKRALPGKRPFGKPLKTSSLTKGRFSGSALLCIKVNCEVFSSRYGYYGFLFAPNARQFTISLLFSYSISL